MRYIYSTIRFVPDAARGEFVNVGALVGSEDAGEWKLRLVENPKRARALDNRRVLPALWSAVDRIQRQLDAYDEAVESSTDAPFQPTEAWLQRLWEDSRNVFQISRPAPIVSEDVDQALDIIFDELIVDFEARVGTVATKKPVLKATREGYEHEGIHKGPHLAERKLVRSRNHGQLFDFVVANGTAVQLAQGWSFQRIDLDQLTEEIKAWAWTVRDIRNGGGEVTFRENQQMRVPNSVDVQAVYIPPSDLLSESVLKEAMNAFEEVNVIAVPVESSDTVGRRAHELLVGAGVQLDI
jgi:Protein of unknown function (DUF3037)